MWAPEVVPNAYTGIATAITKARPITPEARVVEAAADRGEGGGDRAGADQHQEARPDRLGDQPAR